MYPQMIQQATGCSEAEARDAENVMRHDIFHSTLDWQPRALFDKAARLAVAYLRGEASARVTRAIERGAPVPLTRCVATVTKHNARLIAAGKGHE